jgi:maleate isomerase
LELGRGACDAVFVSCTNLRTFGILPQAEDQLGKSVVSSNQALCWHLLRLSGIGPDHPEGALGPGQLY